MTDLCLFCNGTDESYRPEPETEFICCRCVQLFLAATPDQVRAAYKKAVDGGYPNKAKALEIFFKEGVLYEQEAGKAGSGMVRERPLRTVRPSRHELRA